MLNKYYLFLSFFWSLSFPSFFFLIYFFLHLLCAFCDSFGAIYGKIYDAKVPDGCSTCAGPGCYQAVFMVSTAALVVGIAANALLAWRTSKKKGGF